MSKNGHSFKLFFLQYRPGKCLLRYIYSEKTPFQPIKTRSSKSRKIDIFANGLNHGFGPKMAIFPKFFFFTTIQARKISFKIFYNEKTPFQAKKTKTSKTRKIDIFPKGVNHGFGPKIAIFPNSFFQAIQARKMSFTIFQNKKKSLQTIKTRSSKSRKIDIFPKRLTHGLGPEIAIFPNFFFQAILARKMSFTIFQTKKKPFQATKNTKFKKSKN